MSFFPARGESSTPAKTVCTACLVRDECLAYALEHEELQGVWGALSARERKARMRLRPAS
jgi:WhiB family redox-sensing transcriptional regulator